MAHTSCVRARLMTDHENDGHVSAPFFSWKKTVI